MNSKPEAGSHYRALLQLLRTADTVWNSSRVFFDRWELSPAQFNLLNLLHDSDEGLNQSELGRELLTHRSNITGLVDRLEARGLLQRKAQAGDRRAWRVILTREGRRLISEILPHYHREADTIWQGIPTRKAGDLEDVLREIADNTERSSRRLQEGIR